MNRCIQKQDGSKYSLNSAFYNLLMCASILKVRTQNWEKIVHSKFPRTPWKPCKPKISLLPNSSLPAFGQNMHQQPILTRYLNCVLYECVAFICSLLLARSEMDGCIIMAHSVPDNISLLAPRL